MAEPFKERLSAAAVSRMARAIAEVWPDFPTAMFETSATDGLDALELKARVAHITTALDQCLPDDFATAVGYLLRAMGPTVDVDQLDPADESGLRGFAMLSATGYVARRGLEHFDIALAALRQMTSRFSAEFDIRAFIDRDPDRTFAALEAWRDDPDPHVRRLVSEGTRTRLPWAPRVAALSADPARALRLIEPLADDRELYVRRSVANHLNDISKDDPDLALETARRWHHDASPERAWVVRHALRSLLKKSDPRALELLGFGADVEIELAEFEAAPSVARGGGLPYRFEIRNGGNRPESLVVDVVVHFVKANGKTRPKVFRVASRRVAAGAAVGYDRSLSFREISTRRHYPGWHRIEVQVNGRVLGGRDFELV